MAPRLTTSDRSPYHFFRLGLLALLLAASLGPPRAAEAASLSLDNTLVDATGTTTTTVHVTGSGLPDLPGIILGVTPSVGTGASYAPTITNGAFALDVSIPVNGTANTWTISAYKITGLEQTTVYATVRFYAFSWGPSPSTASPGAAVTLTGSHFPPNLSMPLSFQGSNGATASLGTAVADGNGALSANATIPAGATVGGALFSLQYGVRVFSGRFVFPLLSSRGVSVATDVSISHVELVQAVQDDSNSVPMVTNKSTIVRVYISANGNPGPNGQLTVGGAQLAAFSGATLLGTVSPVNPTVQVAPTPVDYRTLRADAANSFDFLLPASWATSGGISIQVTVNGGGTLPPELNLTNNVNSRQVSFIPVKPVNVVGLLYSSPQHPFVSGDLQCNTSGSVPSAGGRCYSDFGSQLAFLNATYPSRTQLYHLATDHLTYNTVVNAADVNDIYFPGADKVIAKADSLRSQASAPYNGDNWYVLQPWDQCGCGYADIANGAGAATGQDNFNAWTTGAVMAQEVGHNWGQLHTGYVNGSADPNCCPIGTSGTAASGVINALFPSTIGFDRRTMTAIPAGPVNGAHTNDFQSYGGPPNWVSDYTYERLLQKLRTDIPAVVAAPAVVTTTQSYLFASGSITGSGPIFLGTIDPFYVLDRPVGTSDDPGTGAFSIELRDAANTVLYTRNFDLGGSQHPGAGGQPFNQVLPFDSRTQSIVLRHGLTVLATRTRTPNAPTVSILTPQPGVHWNGARTVTWTAADPDGDPLSFAIHYSADGGQTWLPLAVNLTGTSFNVDAGLLQGSRNCLLRVIATDGINTTVAQSGVFGVDPHTPTVSILPGTAVQPNRQAMLTGDGFNPDEGPLPDEQLVWSSDLDGPLGTGRDLVTMPLSPGQHTITLTGTDTTGAMATATTTVVVQGGGAVFVPTALVNAETGW